MRSTCFTLVTPWDPTPSNLQIAGGNFVSGQTTPHPQALSKRLLLQKSIGLCSCTLGNQSLKNGCSSMESHCFKHYSLEWPNTPMKHIWIAGARPHQCVRVRSGKSLGELLQFQYWFHQSISVHFGDDIVEETIASPSSPVSLLITFTHDATGEIKWISVLLGKKTLDQMAVNIFHQ